MQLQTIKPSPVLRNLSFQGVACHLQHLDNDFPVPQPKADGFFFASVHVNVSHHAVLTKKEERTVLTPKMQRWLLPLKNMFSTWLQCCLSMATSLAL